MRRFTDNCLIIVLSALAASCNKEEARTEGLRYGDHNVEMSDVPLVFCADEGEGIDTKGPNPTVLDNLSSFKVTATTGSSTQTAVSDFSSVTFNKTSGSNFRGGKYWPSSDPGYHFYAATKALTYSNNTCSFKPSATIADDVYAYSAGVAYSSSTPPSSVPLTFNHIYAQVGTCTLTKHSDISSYEVSGLTVTITPKLPTANATFTFGPSNSGSWSTTSSHYTNGSAVTLCSALNSTTDNDLWLVPGTYTLTANYHLKIDSWEGDVSQTASVTLSMGDNNNISGTIGKGKGGLATQVTFSVTVTGWNEAPKNVTFN